MLVPPDEHEAEADVWATRTEVWTISIDNLIEYKYALSRETMDRIDVALAIGLGMVREDDDRADA